MTITMTATEKLTTLDGVLFVRPSLEGGIAARKPGAACQIAFAAPPWKGSMMQPLRDQCDTCAFRKDSETSREPDNVMKGMICAMAGLPFYCHHETNLHELKREPTGAELRDNGICRGWQAQVRHYASLGYFSAGRAGRTYRHVIGKLGLALIDRFIESPEKATAQKIADCLRLLASRDMNGRTRRTKELRRMAQECFPQG